MKRTLFLKQSRSGTVSVYEHAKRIKGISARGYGYDKYSTALNSFLVKEWGIDTLMNGVGLQALMDKAAEHGLKMNYNHTPVKGMYVVVIER